VVTSDNRDLAKKLWKAIQEFFAFSQSSNCAQTFNNFLYLTFKEEAVESFITHVWVSIKKMVDVGIDLPQDVLAYLILFEFLSTLNNLKRQIMHFDKTMTSEFVCSHLVQFNESRAEAKESATTDAVLYSNRKGMPIQP
jgi:hypothetical protein